MFANTQMMGLDAAFPDVCLTPPGPVPIPYPNVAIAPTAIPSQVKVHILAAPQHNLRTKNPISNGDNPGVARGIASGTVMSRCMHTTGAFTVIVCGAPASRLTSITMQNRTNIVGARVVPSQPKVMLLAP